MSSQRKKSAYRLFINGCWSAVDSRMQSVEIPVGGLGFTHGLGAFETLRVYRGCPLFWDCHWARLNSAADELEIPLPLDSGRLLAYLRMWLKADDIREARLKIILWAGPSMSGSYWDPPETALMAVEIVSLAEDLSLFPATGVSVCLAEHPWTYRAPNYKPIAYAPYLLARRAAKRRGFDDALLADEQGTVLESSCANLIWEKDGRLGTTSPDATVIPGTVIGALLEHSRQEGRPIEETDLHLEQLQEVSGLWLANAYWGVVPVIAVENKWTQKETSAQLNDLLKSWYEGLVLQQLNLFNCQA